MKQVKVVVWAALAALLFASFASGDVLTDRQQRDWIRYTIPLPKSISIPESVKVSSGSVAIVAPAQTDMVTGQAVKELRELLGPAPSGDPAFTITMAIGGPDSTKLESLKNSDQAYSISPDGKSGLKLIARTSRGLYYAAGTLQQLIRARTNGSTIEMPLAAITDWPDLQDRGLWGSNSDELLKWMGGLKFNIDEQISARDVDPKTGRGRSWPKDPDNKLCNEGPLYGINPVPVVLHLDQVMGWGMLQAYPKFKGIGGEGGAICYSQPEFVGVLADWIVDLGSLPNVKEVDVWMSENLHGKGGCKCAECSKTERSLLESRTIVKAWRKAQERLPSLGLRILSSEETYKMNGKIIEELPKEVKFWYYHSQRTYDTDHKPMIYKELEDFARAGRWIGVCPSLTQYDQPFTCPEFPRYRMNEFVDKQLSGVIAYATPRVQTGALNVEGAAEWSWNSKGRTAREFALSYALRHGIKPPEVFADWAVTQGAVSWHVYACDWPNGDKKGQPGHVATLLRQGRVPDLGVSTYGVYGVPFAGIKNVDQLNADVAASARAVKLARKLGVAQYIHESLTVQGYINSLKALYELRRLSNRDGLAIPDRQEARKYFQMYLDSLQQSIDHLPKWEQEALSDPNSFMCQGEVEQLKDMQSAMKQTAESMGVKLD